MPYESIPGVRATYLDGAFAIPNASTQPRILVIGPASSGQTNELYNVTNVSHAEAEFGADTEILKAVHEAVAQGADNLSLLRSGGKQGSFEVSDGANTLTITPEYRDDTILSRYALIIENDGSANRILVYDITDESFVYDSDEILVLDEGIVEVIDDGLGLCTVNDKDALASVISLNDVVSGDFAGISATLTKTAGADGRSVSLAERYAALSSSYHLLDYRDADLVIPAGVYIDADNIRDDASHTGAGTGSDDSELYGYYWKGVPQAGSEEDALGFVWQYRHKGEVYTYMADCSDHFSTLGSAAAATITIDTDLVITASKAGKGGNGITIEVIGGGTAGAETATVTETDHGFAIAVTAEAGVSTTTQMKAAIDTALASSANTLRSGVLPSTLVSCTGGTGTASVQGPTNLTGGVGGAMLSHTDLTGDAVPAAVTTELGSATDAQLREDNFAHQLASFCHVASANWSQMLGAISFKAPESGFSRVQIANWVGTLPEYTDNGVDKYIDSPSDNGSGILGHRLVAGESKTSDGYRSAQVDGGNSTDGYAYGGIILTEGAALPNGNSWPYGINDADERLDAGGKPVDIGRHVFATYDWPILANGFNGGTSYRGSLAATFFGKVATMPENEEPIGSNGRLFRLQSPTRVHSTQINDLAQARVIGVRRDTTGALILNTARNLAHPDSDYVRLSTIRCVNRMLAAVRNICRPYIGKAFSAQSLASMQAAIDGLIVAERGEGMHNGATARIEYTREDRIMGRLTVKLRMVPPFSIEAIDVETSLAADESEL